MEGLVLSGVGEVLFTEWKGWYCQGLVKSCLLSGRVGIVRVYIKALNCIVPRSKLLVDSKHSTLSELDRLFQEDIDIPGTNMDCDLSSEVLFHMFIHCL